jgi:gamma-glutamyl-gamma-aminobutyraldehyde dehydrogenase
LEYVAAQVESLRVGNPLDPTNDLGPLVNARQLGEIRNAISRGESQGARLIVDGRGAPVPAKGFYLGPSVAVDVQPGDFLEQEELFGPVLSVVIFDELEEAIKIANGTRYGLGAAVWSSNIEAVQKMADRLVAGIVIVNGVGGVPIEVPFGGFRQSGFGRDRSLHAFANYSDLKSIILRARQ